MECKGIVLADYVIVLSGTVLVLSMVYPSVRSSLTVTVSGSRYTTSFSPCGDVQRNTHHIATCRCGYIMFLVVIGIVTH